MAGFDAYVSQGGTIGLLALIVVGFLTGWIYSRPAMDAERERTARAEAQVKSLIEQQERLTASVEALATRK